MASAAPKPSPPIKLFCGYAHEDQTYRDQLKTFLSFLVHDKKNEFWYDGIIMPGRGWDSEIKANLNKANLIVFLISPNFLASEYAYTVELRRALERRQAGEAEVVPVIIRHCPWDQTFARHLQALPTGLVPVKKWEDPDEAWTNVVNGLLRVVNELRSKYDQESMVVETEQPIRKVPSPYKSHSDIFSDNQQANSMLEGQNTLFVGTKDKEGYESIAQALSVAPVGARIIVFPGQYQQGIKLDKEVEIIGAGSRDEILVTSYDTECLIMEADKASIKNITLRCLASETGKKYCCIHVPSGRLLLENCDISSRSLACVVIHGQKADPVFTKCKIHSGRQEGVFVYVNGKGSFDNCEIVGNSEAGILVLDGGHPTLKQCRINRNGYQGVWIKEGGSGTFQDKDLTDNALGPWKIEDDCRVIQSGNQEDDLPF